MKPEQRLWKKKVYPNVKNWGHFCRIENSVGTGQGDVNYCVDGSEGWLELKVWPREILPTQVNWSTLRLRAGGTIWVMVQVKDDIYIVNPLAYSRAQTALDVESESIWKLSRDGWGSLRELLRRRTRASGLTWQETQQGKGPQGRRD